MRRDGDGLLEIREAEGERVPLRRRGSREFGVHVGKQVSQRDWLRAISAVNGSDGVEKAVPHWRFDATVVADARAKQIVVAAHKGHAYLAQRSRVDPGGAALNRSVARNGLQPFVKLGAACTLVERVQFSGALDVNGPGSWRRRRVLHVESDWHLLFLSSRA